MQFENTFDVDAPIEEVWKTLLDVERVAPCVPGAEVLEQTGDDSYKVAIKVKVGPMSMQYKGDVDIVEADPETHRAMMRTKAREARGQGTANADVTMSLSEQDGRTHGTIQTDVQLSGRVAAMGRGIIQDVSAKIVDQFSDNLATMLSGPSGNGAAAEAPAATAAEAPATAAETATTAEPATPTPEPSSPAEAKEPPRTPPPPKPVTESELSVTDIAGAVIAGRLKDRRTQGVLAAAIGVLLLLLVRRATR
jgi:carbon monoxide dehydrogenase subunit G